jgi:beta-glucanase (GH16 family)
MRKLILAAAILATSAILVPGQAFAAPPGSGWSLAFEDGFDGTAVDPAKWHYRTDIKANSAQRPENVTVGGGLMSINLKQESFGGKSFTGGGLVSKQRFRYGYYETRMKINDGAGWHSSFWLQAGDGSTTFPADQRTEIDGAEIDSVNPQNVHMGLHTWKGSGASGPYHPGTTFNSGLDLRQWHVWGVDWAETSVKFYLDGVLKYTAAYTPAQWTHDNTAIWLTSIAYGSSLPDVSKLPSAVQFDYIRYWQKDYHLDNGDPGYSETGTWYASTLTGWTYQSPTRYAACHTAANTATWRPSLRAAGTYQVMVFNIVHSGSDRNARYDVAGSATFVDGTVGTTGWLSLGTFSLPSGTSTFVKLTSSGTGCARADAVKFVRV